MKPLTAKEVECYLKAYGYKLDRIRGSHHVWVNDAVGKSIPVPHHGNEPLKQGILNGIFNDAGIPKPLR